MRHSNFITMEFIISASMFVLYYPKRFIMKTLTNLFIRSLLLTAVTFAQWSSDPASPQLLGSGVQAQVKATSDGGVYVAWLTNMGGYHVYLQRFDATGVAQFDDGGMLVSDHNNDSWIAVFHMNLAVDSDNNAIITVLDQRSGPWNVYAYKISSDGSMLWGDDGVSVSNSNQTNYSPRLAVLPDNSVVVAWSPNSTTVEIQRISSDGDLMWGDGILIEDSNESLMSPQPIVDSNGDLLVQWIGQSGPFWAADSKIYLQKYDLDGNAQWDNPAVAVGPVVFPMGNWSQQLVVEAGGDSFSAWTQMSGNVQNAVSQHITGEGEIAWIGGVDLSINSNNFRMSPILSVAEQTQELMAVWREANGSQSERGISAQRLDSSGNQLWGSNGVTVVALNSSYDYLDLSVAGFGEELISAYIQQSVNMNGDIYANRLDAEGNSVWTDVTVIVTNTGTTKSDMMAGKGSNCLFIAWTENGSVYAHCLREDGTLGAPDVGSSDCTADDGTEGVELWDDCYSIENTDSLDLSESGLIGEIPSEIGNLPNLTFLELSQNQLTGVIPTEIGNLINLKWLSLWENQLTGNIPESIWDLVLLENLDLDYNQLIGSIPPEIGNLTNLHHLFLDNNQFTGQIPQELGNLVNLELLNLGDNQLTGEIPSEIGNLIINRWLYLHNNELTGEIPPEIWNLTNLRGLYLFNNQFTGSIPSEIGNLTNLERLVMNLNQFTGPIPSEIGNLTNLNRLKLHTNQFTGSIPETLCNLSNLTWSLEDSSYSVSTLFDNQLCPPYLSCIEDYVGEQDTSNCEQGWACTADDGTEGVEFWGECFSIENTTELGFPLVPDTATTFPEELFSLINLTSLSIWSNITEPIPTSIANLINLVTLEIVGIETGGAIPSEIGNLTNLTTLILRDNEHTGFIPTEIGNLTNLISLDLSSNQLTGEIPPELFSLVNLSGYISPTMVGSILIHGLNLSDNLLSGEIPFEIGNLINLISIDFSQNQFTGEIPSEIFNLINLESLNLSDNQLTGEISFAISDLINLSGIVTTGHMSITTYPALDLSENKFSGAFPESLCSLPIEWEYNSFGESEFSIDENQFCPPYPSCIEDYVGEQDTTNCEQVSIIDGTLPITYNLYNAYPNPFNPVTTLQYDLPEDAMVNSIIYDMMGRIVINLVRSQQNAGYKSIQWNATNNTGQPVSAGLYLYTIKAGDYIQTKKMVLLK